MTDEGLKYYALSIFVFSSAFHRCPFCKKNRWVKQWSMEATT